MDDQQVGALFRAVRIRRRMRQVDVAEAAGVARSWVSRVERGHLAGLPVDRMRAIASVLEIRVALVVSWRGGEAARVVNERHSRMHELVATRIRNTAGWEFATEVTFARWGERGVIDILAWHAASRTVLVIELKTEIADPAGLVAQVDRYRRLAPAIGRDRGWDPTSVATWVLVADSATNRRQLARHRTMLRNAFPLDGRTLDAWCRDPSRVGGAGAGAGAAGGGAAGRVRAEATAAGGGSGRSPRAAVSGLGFLADDHPGTSSARLGPTRRVRRRPGSLSGRAGGNPGESDLAAAPTGTHLRATVASERRSGPDTARRGVPDPG